MLCIYHGNCADGFGAAWAMEQFCKKNEFGVRYHAGKYDAPPPDVTDELVYIVDFSYKRPVLLDMIEKSESVVILDHHKTAAEDLRDLPRKASAEFDMNRSGAIITWEHFHVGPPPPLLKHIEDRDLWRFALPFTREIQANLFSYPYDFEVWDQLMQRPLEELIADGKAIERKHHKDIRELLALTQRRLVIGGYNVPAANLPYTMSSDAGHIMAKGEPFAACYYDDPDGRHFSLRSTDAGVDVSAIAKKYGGGGHRNASGFKADWVLAASFEEIK